MQPLVAAALRGTCKYAHPRALSGHAVRAMYEYVRDGAADAVVAGAAAAPSRHQVAICRENIITNQPQNTRTID